MACANYDDVVIEYDVKRGVALWERDVDPAMATSSSADHMTHVWDLLSPSTGWATALRERKRGQ